MQAVVPEQILFLQPYSDSPISLVAKDPPSSDDPVRLYVSATKDLTHVHYVGEIVGWEDKRTISPARRAVFDKLIAQFQPGEPNVYAKGVNVLVVRRMLKFATPLAGRAPHR